MISDYTCYNGCCNIQIKPYKYKKFFYSSNKHKAGIFIYDKNKNKILLVQSRGQFWGIPKGTMQDSESIVDCAIREVYEETGLSISKDHINKSITILNRSTYFYFEMDECSITVQDSIIDNDANGIGWFNIDCLKKLVISGNISLNKHCIIALERFLGITI